MKRISPVMLSMAALAATQNHTEPLHLVMGIDGTGTVGRRNIYEGHVPAHIPSALVLGEVMREAEAKRERKYEAKNQQRLFEMNRKGGWRRGLWFISLSSPVSFLLNAS